MGSGAFTIATDHRRRAQSIDCGGGGHDMFFRQFGSLLATIAVYYAALLACYLITCVVVTRLNRHAIKIQSSRQTPTSQIKRDFRQSVVSLAVIAAMLGAGDWSYTTLGWGLRPLPGIGGAVLSGGVPLVLVGNLGH